MVTPRFRFFPSGASFRRSHSAVERPCPTQGPPSHNFASLSWKDHTTQLASAGGDRPAASEGSKRLKTQGPLVGAFPRPSCRPGKMPGLFSTCRECRDFPLRVQAMLNPSKQETISVRLAMRSGSAAHENTSDALHNPLPTPLPVLSTIALGARKKLKTLAFTTDPREAIPLRSQAVLFRLASRVRRC